MKRTINSSEGKKLIKHINPNFRNFNINGRDEDIVSEF